MTSLTTSTRIAAANITLSVLLFAAQALAGPGFIAETQVTHGSVFAEIGIRFRCGVQYLGHDPSGASDILRIRLETTTVCTGAAPSIANVKEQHRPLSADAASVESIEYDGESPGNQVLRVNFTRPVRFDVRAGMDRNAIDIRVFAEPDADSGEPATSVSGSPLPSAARQ